MRATFRTPTVWDRPHRGTDTDYYSCAVLGFSRANFIKNVRLSWLWRFARQMHCWAQYPWVCLVFLGVTLDSAEAPFAKTPFSWFQIFENRHRSTICWGFPLTSCSCPREFHRFAIFCESVVPSPTCFNMIPGIHKKMVWQSAFGVWFVALRPLTCAQKLKTCLSSQHLSSNVKTPLQLRTANLARHGHIT